MRTALAVAALAAGALAVPYKRDVYTDVEWVYVTDVVTVTAGQEPTAAAVVAVAATTTAAHYAHHNHGYASSAVESTTSQASSYEAPTSSTAEAYSAPTSSTAEAYSAPATTEASSSPSYVAPTTTQAPETSSAAAYSASPSASGFSDTDYSADVIYSHNIHRANHSVSDLVWDQDLADIATEIANTCVYAHNTEMGGGGYGQNIAAGVDPTNVSAIITDMFYNGEQATFASLGLYGNPISDPTDPSMEFDSWGHFSQIVWAATTSVGCATVQCATLENAGGDVEPWFTVCNYQTPGNVADAFADNINRPLGFSVANWNTGLIN